MDDRSQELGACDLAALSVFQRAIRRALVTNLGQLHKKFYTLYKNNFYYVSELTYYDKALNQSFKRTEFNHYYTLRGAPNFFACQNNEDKRLIEVINAELKKTNQPVFVGDSNER